MKSTSGFHPSSYLEEMYDQFDFGSSISHRSLMHDPLRPVSRIHQLGSLFIPKHAFVVEE
jgi:hypothetical protein